MKTKSFLLVSHSLTVSHMINFTLLL